MNDFPIRTEIPTNSNKIMYLSKLSTANITSYNVETKDLSAPLPIVKTYPKDLLGPFVIILSGNISDITSKGITHVGKSLRKLNVKPKYLKVIGRNAVRLEFSTIDAAKRILTKKIHY